MACCICYSKYWNSCYILTGCKKVTEDIYVGADRPYAHMSGSSYPSFPNCYSYTIGSSVNEQPGMSSRRFPTKWYDVEDIGPSVEADLLARGMTIRRITGPYGEVYSNEYRIALRVGTTPFGYDTNSGTFLYDYHFMVQTSTGLWAEKYGAGGASMIWPKGKLQMIFHGR